MTALEIMIRRRDTEHDLAETAAVEEETINILIHTYAERLLDRLIDIAKREEATDAHV